jgi:hypothetical protein
MTQAAVAKYLRVHAEPEAAVAETIDDRYHHVVAIPASDEEPALLDGFVGTAQRASDEVLCIVVVNGHDQHGPEVHLRNGRCLEALSKRAQGRSIGAGVWQGTIDGIGLLLLDRASEGWRVPRRQGVGLARKIGCDVALAMQQQGKLRSRWIHTSDADVRLPDD